MLQRMKAWEPWAIHVITNTEMPSKGPHLILWCRARISTTKMRAAPLMGDKVQQMNSEAVRPVANDFQMQCAALPAISFHLSTHAHVFQQAILGLLPLFLSHICEWNALWNAFASLAGMEIDNLE